MALRSALMVQAGKRLGYDEQAFEQEAIGSVATVEDLSITVTIPAGRRIEVHAHLPLSFSGGPSDLAWLRIKRGSTVIGETVVGMLTTAIENQRDRDVWAEFTSTAGTFTFTVEVEVSDGTASLPVIPGTNRRPFLIVDDVGPA